jgi:hypothetical protein
MKRYTRPELNITGIRRAAKLMLSAGGSRDCDRGIRAYRDLLITTVRMRKRKLQEWRAASQEGTE